MEPNSSKQDHALPILRRSLGRFRRIYVHDVENGFGTQDLVRKGIEVTSETIEYVDAWDLEERGGVN